MYQRYLFVKLYLKQGHVKQFVRNAANSISVPPYS